MAFAPITAAGQQGDEDRFKPTHVLYYSGELRGEMWPCGCSTNMGGLAYRATKIASMRATDKLPNVLIDLGNFCRLTNPKNPEPTLITADTTLKIFDMLGYDAVGLGKKELFLRDNLKQVLEGAPDVKFVSSNLIFPEDWKVNVERWRMLNIGDKKVGFFSLVGDRNVVKAFGNKYGYEGRDPVVALAESIEQAGDATDFNVVGISGLSKREIEEVKKIPGIYLILTTKKMDPESKLYSAHQLESGKRIGGIYMEINEITPKPRRYFPSISTVLVDKVEPDAEIQLMVAGAHEKLNEFREFDAHGPYVKPNKNYYRGAFSCLPCHEDQYKQWTGTAHSQSFRTLVRDDAESKAECLSCHTTGFENGDAGQSNAGYAIPQPMIDDSKQAMVLYHTEKAWLLSKRMVGCEACHGPGTTHMEVRRGLSTKVEEGKMKIPTEADCRVCHDPQNDPDFDFNSARVAISH